MPPARHTTASDAMRPWIVLGVLIGALIGVLVFAPARWLAQTVASTTGQRLQLLDARGTVWDGSAQVLLTGGSESRDAMALPSRMYWRLQPRWTYLGLSLQADCCTPEPVSAQLEPGWGSLTLRLNDGLSHWPAALLAGLGTPWNTVQAQGHLRLSSQALTLTLGTSAPQIVGSARLELVDLSSALSTLKPLGSYRLTLQGGNTVGVQLETLPDSRLQLSGSGQWLGARLHFTGSASAEPAYQDALANLLNIIGRRSGAQSIIQVG